MSYIKVPEVSILLQPPLSNVQYHILYKLCELRFRFTRSHTKDAWFFIQDRDLASLCHCSTAEVWKAKNLFAAHGLLEFEVRARNRTYYHILYP
jgi:hypothetical protein